MKKVFGILMLLLSVFFAGKGFSQDQAGKDDAILKQYFAKKKIKPLRTATGLYYTITRKGTGDNAKVGQRVSMAYYGKFLDGRKFDANVDESFHCNRPFSFNLGTGAVIRGWDEGVQLLNTGARATFYIPSGLAYGPSGNGPIPPNAVIMFDVEVLSINK